MTWRVTWNEDKREQSIAKHGIDFEGLFDTFDGHRALVVEDRRRGYGEIRYNMLVKFSNTILHVTFTLRAGAYHQISARRARWKERKAYHA